MLNTMSEVDKASRDLKPSPELFEMIQAAASSLTGFAQLWESIRKKGNSEGFNDEQLQRLLRPLLQNKLGMNRNQVYYLFHKEEIKEKQQHPLLNIQQIDEKKEPEQISNSDSEEEEEQPTSVEEEEEEEPTELELLKIENMQLKDALKKVQQFQPAGGHVETFPALHDEQVFEYLRKRENRINIFYYDNYGIDLVPSRLIAQLKNSGVKTFKRLYFEV